MDPDLGRFREVWAAAGTTAPSSRSPPATLRALANAVVAPIAEPAAATGWAPAEPASTDDGSTGAPDGPPRRRRVSDEPRQAVVSYPGGLRVRYRWAGSGQGAAVFALTRGRRPAPRLRRSHGPDLERLCRAELRGRRARPAPGPPGSRRRSSTSRAGLPGTSPGCSSSSTGSSAYGLAARTGELRWLHRSRLAAGGRPRLVAPRPRPGPGRDRDVRPRGERRRSAGASPTPTSWPRPSSSAAACVLTSYGGLVRALDPATGIAAG